MSNLRILKTVYDKLGNDFVRSVMLTTAEQLGIRKDIIRMDTNGYCNIRCIMCRQADIEGKNQFISLEKYKTIIDMFAPTTRMLYLSCAHEPLITPGFTEYIKYAKSKGIPHISFCTNALLLNNNIISCLVDDEIDEIIISFNGFCKEDYNRIMKGSDYERVCANIKALSNYKKKRNAVKPHIRLNSILLKSNLENFENIYSFMLDNNIDTIQFRELMLLENQNNPIEVNKELISDLSNEKYVQVASKIKNMAKQLQTCGKEIILPSTFWDYTAQSDNSEICDNAMGAGSPITSDNAAAAKADMSIHKKQNPKKHSCSIPCFSYWIDRMGEVRVCGYDDNGIIGNALSKDYKILKARRKAFQKIALAGECSRELCTTNIDSSSIV